MKKFLFDLFPLILFFAAFKLADSMYVATAVAIGASFAQLIGLKITRKSIETTHWINLAVIVIFGGATLVFQDDTFIKWKPTVLYWIFAGILLAGRIFFRRNLLQKVMGAKIELPPSIWDKMTYSWSIFFMASGALNLYVAFSGQYTEAQWVNFKVFGLMILLLLFVIAQSIWLSRHIKDASEP